MNMPFMALKLEYPISIQGECGDLNPQTYPSWAKVVYEFPARGELPPVTLHWYEGHNGRQQVLPPTELTDKVMKEYNKKTGRNDQLRNSASLIVGEKGLMYSPDDSTGVELGIGLRPMISRTLRAFPAAGLPPPTRDEKDAEGKGIDIDEGNKIEWLAAARGGKPSIGNFSYAGLLAETVLLGNIAIKNPGKKLEWDGTGLTFPKSPEANALLKRQYRAPWSL